MKNPDSEKEKPRKYRLGFKPFGALIAALALAGIPLVPSHAEPQRESGGSTSRMDVLDITDLTDLTGREDLFADHRILFHEWIWGPSTSPVYDNRLRAHFISMGDPVYGYVKVILELWHKDPNTGLWNAETQHTRTRYPSGSFVSSDWYDSIPLDFSFGALEPGEWYAAIRIDPDGVYDEYLGAGAGKSFYFNVREPNRKKLYKRRFSRSR